ncbi:MULTISPECIES: hypothetical protein [unclassified Mesorhizobium]|uniref:hypothetical protein n=1 Tax=unclassified Mesorhizobium TaxID=325217 RepID=UPI001FED842D|nr:MULTISPECIES: hypothetical protein [unclassified Mesorhizobium]
MLLIHYNSRHVIEKIITPGEVKISAQTIVNGSVHAGLDVSLGDLREWHMLRAWCKNCSHHAEIEPAGLIRRQRGRFSARVAIEAARFGWRFTSCPGIEGQTNTLMATLTDVSTDLALMDSRACPFSCRERGFLAFSIRQSWHGETTRFFSLSQLH